MMDTNYMYKAGFQDWFPCKFPIYQRVYTYNNYYNNITCI